jgi:hypothetical protein
MTLRSFCDLCDNEIKKDTETFGVSGDIKLAEDYNSYRQTDIQLNGVWVPKEFNHSMVCRTCFSVIRIAVHGLMKNG